MPASEHLRQDFMEKPKFRKDQRVLITGVREYNGKITQSATPVLNEKKTAINYIYIVYDYLSGTLNREEEQNLSSLL